jgi:PhnB protein
MRLTPNLSFGGQCEAAFKFYERCFGGKIVFMLTYGKSAMAEQVPLGWREKIFHATLTVGNGVLMGADPVPAQYEQPKRLAVMLSPRASPRAPALTARESAKTQPLRREVPPHYRLRKPEGLGCAPKLRPTKPPLPHRSRGASASESAARAATLPAGWCLVQQPYCGRVIQRSGFSSDSMTLVYSNPMIFFRSIPWRS